MNVLEFLDGGVQHQVHGSGGRIDQIHCVRNHQRDWDTDAMPGSGFCRPCHAYMTGDTDEDPLEGRATPKAPPLPPEPPVEADRATWDAYMATISRSYT